jgi:UDP-2,3-diacylglucosamine hydrolase
VSATKPVLLASDVHLGAVRSGRERDFFAWLEQAADVASWIILNGDLFDFWFEYRGGTTRGHDDILAELRRTVDAGVPVTLMGGNHDWWGGRYLREEVGIEFLEDPVVRKIAGRRALLAHGDGLGKGDLGYLAMRSVLRGRLTRWAFGRLPPALGDRIARGVSRTEHKWEEWGEKQRARCEALQAWAEARLAEDAELELVLLGHTHEPRIREVSKGQWYVNSGDWVLHRSYVTLEVGRPPRLTEWTGAIA